MKPPHVFVSFVVATFNCGERVNVLRKTIASFAGFPCEFLIADGGSLDNTVRDLASSGAHVVCSEPDRGIYDAWNKALPFCAGSYVSFIGVDDVPRRAFYEEARRRSGLDGRALQLIYGDSVLRLGRRERLVIAPLTLKLTAENDIVFDMPHPGALNNRALFEGARFDPSYRLAGDLDFYISVRRKINGAVLKIPQVQASIEASGLSRQPAAANIYETEYKRIETERGVSLGYGTSLSLKKAIARFPSMFSLLRDLSWLLRARRIVR